MELRRYIAILRKRSLLIVLALIVGVTTAYLTTSRTAIFEAEAQVYVGAIDFTQDDATDFRGISNENLVGVQRVLFTYVQMINNDTIASAALGRVPGVNRSVDYLLANTSVVATPGTSLLSIKVSDREPAVAQELANAMADAFDAELERTVSSPSEGTVPQLPAYVFDRANLPDVPAPNGLTQRMILGFVLAFMVSAAAAFLLEYLDITIKTASDAEQRLELPVLGVIPMERQAPFTPSRAASSIIGA